MYLFFFDFVFRREVQFSLSHNEDEQFFQKRSPLVNVDARGAAIPTENTVEPKKSSPTARMLLHLQLFFYCSDSSQSIWKQN